MLLLFMKSNQMLDVLKWLTYIYYTLNLFPVFSNLQRGGYVFFLPFLLKRTVTVFSFT